MATIKELFNLSGKCAIVIGVAQGICQANALGLAEEGAHLLVAGQTEPGLQQAVAAIRDCGAARHVTDAVHAVGGGMTTF